VAALEAAVDLGGDVALLQVDAGAQRLQRLQVQVNRPCADGAAAGQRNPSLAAARQQRPQHQHAGPHAAHQVVGGGGVGDLAGRQVEHPPGMAALGGGAVHAEIDAVLGQQVGHGRDVDQMRQVAKGQGLFGEQAGRH